MGERNGVRTKEGIKSTAVKHRAGSREADPDPSDMQVHTNLELKAENIGCWWVKMRRHDKRTFDALRLSQRR